MNKVSLILIMSFLLFLSVGCNQNPMAENNQISTSTSKDFSTVDGRVVFQNYNSYAEFFKNTSEAVNIVSITQLKDVDVYEDPFEIVYKTHASKSQLQHSQLFNAEDNKPSNSELLLSLLNEKGIVQVGDRIIRYTKYYDFSVPKEHINSILDDEFLIEQIQQKVTSNKVSNTKTTTAIDLTISPVTYSIGEPDCPVDEISEEPIDGPCEDISPGFPPPPSGSNIVIDESLTPIDDGRYVRFIDDRRAQLQILFRGSNARLEVKPIVSHEIRFRVANIFFDWKPTQADLLYADIHDVLLSRSTTEFGPGVLYTPPFNYVDFEDIGTFGVQNTSEFNPSNYVFIPLDDQFFYSTRSIKTVNYIEEERGGLIYKVKRIAKTTYGITLDAN